MEHDGMPGLAGIAAIMRWLEELIVVLSAPILIGGMVITLVDLLTDGALTVAVPWMLFAWAISQALGIEANISGAAHKAKRAFDRGSWGALTFYVGLVAALFAVAAIAGYAYSFHQSQGVPINETLTELGISPAMWTAARSILAVALVVISAALRFTGEKTSAVDVAQKLREEIELAPLRAQAQAARVIGVRSVVQAAMKGVPAAATTPLLTATVEEGPYTPEDVADIDTTPVIRIVTPSGGRTGRKKSTARKPRGAASWETEARLAWSKGARTVGQMERAVDGISHTAAQYWIGVFKGEARGADAVRREA